MLFGNAGGGALNPLSPTAAAQQHLASGSGTGKYVISVRQGE